MKQYVIDELRIEDYQKVKNYLDEHCIPATFSGVYWMTVPEEILTDLQKTHVECQPYYIGIELDENQLSCGLLVRASGNIRCHCIAYTNEDQRNWLVNTIDSVMDHIGVIV